MRINITGKSETIWKKAVVVHYSMFGGTEKNHAKTG
jgi:hypothetical protein